MQPRHNLRRIKWPRPSIRRTQPWNLRKEALGRLQGKYMALEDSSGMRSFRGLASRMTPLSTRAVPVGHAIVLHLRPTPRCEFMRNSVCGSLQRAMSSAASNPTYAARHRCMCLWVCMCARRCSPPFGGGASFVRAVGATVRGRVLGGWCPDQISSKQASVPGRLVSARVNERTKF